MQGNTDIYQITPIIKMKKGYQPNTRQPVNGDFQGFKNEHIFKKKVTVITMN